MNTKRYAVFLINGQVVRECTGVLPPTVEPEETIVEVPWGQIDYLKTFHNEGVFHCIPVPPTKDHIFDYAIKQWIDPRTLQDFKDVQWVTIKQSRTQAEYGGFTWDGSTFDSDAVSQNRITGAVQLAQINPVFTIGWTLADNTVRTLSAADMVSVGVALGVHVGTQFAKAQALRVQIEAATTREGVEAVVW